jgi:hypothetical protein
MKQWYNNQKELLELVHDQIQLRHYSHRTEESYIHWIKEYIYYFSKFRFT